MIFTRLKTYIIITLTAGYALFMAGCGSAHDHEDHDEHTEAAHDDHDHDHDDHDDHDHEGHGDEIKMNPEAAKKAGIRLATVERGGFRDIVKAAGMIENTLGGQAVVSAPASGMVSFRGDFTPGAAVRAGQAMFVVSSKGTELADASASLKINVDLAAKELKRADDLVKDKLISRQEYDRIKSDYESAVAAASGVASRSRNGMAVSSPISGYVVNLNVSPGSFVNIGDPLATVAHSRRIVVRADVSELQYNELGTMSGANIILPGSREAISLQNKNLRIISKTATINPGSHYIPVYMEFDNPGSIIAGSVVEVYLLGAERQGVISVPRSALVEDNGYFYVYVEAHPNIYRKADVKVGANDGSRVEILAGLHEGEKIVTQGALRIKMAGMGSAIPGHSHHH